MNSEYKTLAELGGEALWYDGLYPFLNEAKRVNWLMTNKA